MYILYSHCLSIENSITMNFFLDTTSKTKNLSSHQPLIL